MTVSFDVAGSPDDGSTGGSFGLHLPGAYEWNVDTDEVALSTWLLHERGLPARERRTTFARLLVSVHVEDREAVEHTFRDAARAGRPVMATYRVVGGDGRLRTVHNAADVVTTTPRRVIGAAIDAAVLQGAAQRVDTSFLDAVLETLVDGLVACSRTGVPIVINSAARRLYEAVSGAPWNDHSGRGWIERLLWARPRPEQLAPWRSPLDVALSGSPLHDVEVAVGDSTSSRRTIVLSARPLSVGEAAVVQGAVVTLRDVTDQRDAEATVARQAKHDRVTDLPNRRQFLERLTARLTAGDVPAVVVVHVGGIAALSEAGRFDAGEAAMRSVAQWVAGAVSPAQFPAGIGAERLALVESATQATELTARLSALVADPRVRSAPGEPTLVAHLGIAYTDGATTAETALRNAETAAQAAYDRGVPVVTHQGDAQVTRAMRAALTAGEFVLHYQPIYELESRRVIGVEALVRWNRPGVGIVLPGEFIDAAERTGLITELGEWVLRNALADAARWIASGTTPAGFRIAVNVSAYQLEPNFTDVVRDALAIAGVAPGVLRIEVTESVLMRDVRAAADLLSRLRSMGVGVSIDDFGTGYSSLAYLRDFPTDELKIDRSFVGDLGNDGATSLVGGIVSIAHALGLDAVAEGVETEDQLAALSTVGCDVVQGFLLSRPIPADRIEELLATTSLPTTSESTTQPARDRPTTVLIADDDEDIRLLVKMSLVASGFLVHEVGDGAAALDAARALRPGIVILDIQMPGLDGVAVCRGLRDDPVTTSCTVVMLTATDTSSDKVAAYSAGADDYVVKPFSPRELVSRVRTAHHRRIDGRTRSA